MAFHARVLWLAPHHHFVTLDLERCGKARREATQMVDLCLLRGDGTRDRFVLRIVSDKGKGSAHERRIFYSYVQHQADPVGMLAISVAGFEGETPDAVEDRLVLVDLDSKRHVGTMAHDEVGTHVNRHVGNL